jgi:hypothetical protein
MPYYDTPLAANRINATQPLIRNNFTTINAGFSIDHIGYDIGVDVGKHKKITLVQQPAPAFAAGEIGFYNLAGALLYHNLAGVDLDISTLGFNAVTGNRFIKLPSGIILCFGNRQGSAVGDTEVKFPTPLAAVYGTFVTSLNGPGAPAHCAIYTRPDLPGQQFYVGTYNYAGTVRDDSWFSFMLIGA